MKKPKFLRTLFLLNLTLIYGLTPLLAQTSEPLTTNAESDTTRKAGGLMSGVASKAITLVN